MNALWILVIVCLVAVHSHPTTHGDCTKEQLEELNRCNDEVKAAADVQLIKAQLMNAIPQCIPTYQSNCTAKNEIVETCWRECQLEIAADATLSVDERRKSLIALHKCIPHFPEDLWRLMEENMQQLSLGNQQTVVTPSTVPTTSGPQQVITVTHSMQVPSGFDQDNDTCSPDTRELTCLVGQLIKDQRILAAGLKVVEQKKQCYQAAPEQCRFALSNSQDCQSTEFKPLVEKLRLRLDQCVDERRD